MSFVFEAQQSDTSAIRQHDPGFDETSFLSWASDVHFAVVTALNDQNADALRQYVSDNLYRHLAAQIAQAKQQGHPTTKAEPNAERPVIIRADSNASFDTLVVRLHPPAQGGSAPGQAVDWTFQRSSQLKTTPGPLKASTSDTCTSCGAPLSLDGDGCCVYCHTPAAGPKFDWLLVEMETAAPDISQIVASAVSGASPSRSGGRSVGVIVTLVIVFAVGLPILIAALSSSSHRTRTSSFTIPSFTIPSFTIPSISIPNITIPPQAKSLNVELSLSGAIRLSPSQLDQGDLSINGGHFGDCPSTPVQSVGLNLTFDSGDQLMGTFMLPSPAKVGATTDFTPGGTAMLTQTQSNGTATWSLPAGKAGAVTVMVTASGGGTLTWTNLPSGTRGTNPLSGSATWTCS